MNLKFHEIIFYTVQIKERLILFVLSQQFRK